MSKMLDFMQTTTLKKKKNCFLENQSVTPEEPLGFPLKTSQNFLKAMLTL